MEFEIVIQLYTAIAICLQKPEILLGIFSVFILDFSVWNKKSAKFEVDWLE